MAGYIDKPSDESGDTIFQGDRGYALALAEEKFILSLTESISAHMSVHGMTTAELASLLGKPEKYVTKRLSGEVELTCRVAARMAHAVGFRFSVGSVAGQSYV